ncbi:MAG: tannase/feruloyl esterase family alpha/beta hydrolase [Gammaproteobacteria bacterium]
MGGEEHGLKGRRSAFLAAALLTLAPPAQAEIARARRTADCGALAALRLPDVTITLADAIEPGTFTSPDGETHAVPAFCRIHGVARPTSDSLISFELWLPAGGWNGRYYQIGNGGFAGRIYYPSLASELRLLNAVAATDTGHLATAFDAAWAQGHPEKIVDYGYRSLKATFDAAKTLVHAYYSAPARHSYFVGCSNGGRQALMVAQRFPEDWDGVLAGAPAHDWTRQLTAIAWIQKALRSDAASWIPATKLPAIQRAALESCTLAARVVNGVPTDPRSCAFDAAVLACRGEETDECLTAKQAAVLTRIQNGLRDPATGERMLFGFEATAASAEGQWANWMLNAEPGEDSHLAFAEQFFRHMVFEDPDWKIDELDATRDLAFAKEKRVAGELLGLVLDATSTDLPRFEKLGAKLLMYFGWADALISPQAGLDYYERVCSWVPGMTHCQGGPAPHAFGQARVAPALHDDARHDIRRALEAWVERGVAPESIIAAKYVADDPARGVAITATLYPLAGSHGR